MKSKIYNIRFLAIFLIIALSLTSMPLSIFAVESKIFDSKNNGGALSDEEKIGTTFDINNTTVVGEITSRREENVKHFDIGNGMYQAVTYGTAVHRKDSNGVWQDIDNRLFIDSENNVYSTLDGRIKTAVSANTNNPLVSLNENGYSISMTPVTTKIGSSATANIINHQMRSVHDVVGLSIENVAEISNSTSVKYFDVFNSTDIEYVLTSNDIKENIIVNSSQDKYIYSFVLTVDNLIPVLEKAGNIAFYDKTTNEKKYNIPAPFMYDSSGEVSYEVYYDLNEFNGKHVVTITANPEWANASNRTFPITIDPTIQKSIVFDTYVDSASPDANYGSSSELWISSLKTSFLRCTMPSLPSNAIFHSAKLHVYFYYYSYITEGGLTAGAYPILNSWSETGLTWNIAKPNTNTYISPTRLSTAYMSGAIGAYSNSPKSTSFDITEVAKLWYKDSTKNHGIALKYESGTNGSVILKSYEAGSEYRAYFVITYLLTTTPKNITKDTVYSGNLTAGSADIYYFTPSYTGTFTVETFGSTDTYGEVSGNVGTIFPTASDDDSGGGRNFAIGFHQSAGNTTTIIVRHYNTSTGSGAYTLQVRDQRAQIYTFDYGSGDIDTTKDAEEPRDWLRAMGYSVGVYENRPVAHINEIIATTFTRWNSEVIFFSGHGGSGGGSIAFMDNSGNKDWLRDTSAAFTDMSNTKVAVWAACNSSLDPDGTGVRTSIAQRSIDMGAQSAIGWDRVTYVPASRKWTDQFFLELGHTMTVSGAAASAGSVFLWPWDGSYAGWEVLGDGNTLVSYSNVNPKSSASASNLFANADYSVVKQLIESGNYVSYELKGLGKRYYKTINGYLTNEFYDVYDTGVVKSSGETFTQSEIMKITQQKLLDISFSPKKELSAYGMTFNKLVKTESHTVYMKLNNTITPIMITYSDYQNDDGVVYQDVVCINLLTNEYIDYMDICTK